MQREGRRVIRAAFAVRSVALYTRTGVVCRRLRESRRGPALDQCRRVRESLTAGRAVWGPSLGEGPELPPLPFFLRDAVREYGLTPSKGARGDRGGRRRGTRRETGSAPVQPQEPPGQAHGRQTRSPRRPRTRLGSFTRKTLVRSPRRLAATAAGGELVLKRTGGPGAPRRRTRRPLPGGGPPLPRPATGAYGPAFRGRGTSGRQPGAFSMSRTKVRTLGRCSPCTRALWAAADGTAHPRACFQEG